MMKIKEFSANPAVSGINLPYKTLSNSPAKTGFTEYRQRTLWCPASPRHAGQVGIPGAILRSYSKLLVRILKEVA